MKLKRETEGERTRERQERGGNDIAAEVSMDPNIKWHQ